MPTIRWGRRSAGGPVRAGAGGWYLDLRLPPVVTYIDPQTGGGISTAGWNVPRAVRRTRRDYEQIVQRRALDAISDDVISARDAWGAWDNQDP